MKEDSNNSDTIDEISEKVLEKFFTHSTGGNNRQWAKRYQRMNDTYHLLKDLPGVSKEYLDGYKQCMSIFHERPNR